MQKHDALVLVFTLRWTNFRPTSQFHSSQSPLLQKIHLHRIFQTTNFFQRRDSPSAVGTDLVELATLKTLSLQIQQASQNSHISLDCPLLRSATWLDCFGFPLTHSHLVSLQHAADVLLLSDPCKFLFAFTESATGRWLVQVLNLIILH